MAENVFPYLFFGQFASFDRRSHQPIPERGNKRQDARTSKADGDVDATFVIPRVPTEEISPEEIECVNIRDE